MLDGKTAIITGASSGIGREAAKLFARNGARVVLGARREAELAALATEIGRAGGEAVPLAGDVQDEAYAQALVRLAQERFGGLHIALNNAGILGDLGPVEAMPRAAFETVLSVNLTAAFLAAKHQLPALRAQPGEASLIFVSSFVGHTAGMPGMAAYAASKAGMIGMMKCLAAEYGPQGVRVNALLPGGTRTPMNADFNTQPDTEEFVKGIHALKRMAEPEEIAQAALFLAAPASSFVTGSALLADGGVSINKT